LAVRAIENDPLDPRGLTRLAAAEVGRGNYSKAEAAYRKALELNPTAAGTHYFLVSLLIAKGDATAALVEAHLEPDEAFRRTSLALSFGALAQIDDADRELGVLQSTYASRSACQIVEVLAERGEVDMAFEWLDRAYHQRDGGMLKLSSNPLIRNLKNDARLQMILRKLNLLVPLD